LTNLHEMNSKIVSGILFSPFGPFGICKKDMRSFLSFGDKKVAFSKFHKDKNRGRGMLSFGKGNESMNIHDCDTLFYTNREILRRRFDNSNLGNLHIVAKITLISGIYKEYTVAQNWESPRELSHVYSTGPH